MGLADVFERRYEVFLGLKGYDRQDLGNGFYVPEKKILVIRAQEVFTREGDILVFGFDKKHLIGKGDFKKRSIEDSIKEAEDYGGIIGIDHGYFLRGAIPYLRKNPKLLGKIDTIEVHNGNAWLPIPGHLHSNKKAQEFYKEINKYYNIGAFCSSDGHSINEIGSSYSEIEKIDITNANRLNSSLRKSIKNHKNFSKDKKKNSYFGTLVHAVKETIYKSQIK